MIFPIEEYEMRLQQVRTEMANRELDLLLLFGQESVCWLSGFYTPAYFAYAALGVPLEGEPFLVLRFMEEPAAATNSWVKARHTYRDDQDPIALTRRIVEQAGLAKARIGLDMHAWYLTAERYDGLRAALPKARFAGDGRLVDLLRIRKSPLEVEQLRQAARIVEAGLQAAIEATREGVSEREVAAEMARARIRAGSDLPIDGVLTSGERTLQGHGPWTDRRLRRGDSLFYEFHGIRNHYWARMLRSGVIGTPSDEQARVARTVLAAQDAAFAAMRAGVHVREIDRICREPLFAAGLKDPEDYTNRVGYGLGLNFRPSPGEFIREFTPQADFVLEDGMVFHMIMSAQGIGFSDTVLVKADGIEPITRFPRELFLR